jgi:glucose-1-phosphate adenylyltransferase
VLDFVEKPRDRSVLAPLALSEQTLTARGVSVERRYLASMGIYVFRPEVLIRVLEDPGQLDFGKEIIPRAIRTERVHSHFFPGYWEDIGTIRTFYAANIDLASADPPVDLFSERTPIYTRPRFLPGTRLQRTHLEEAIVCDGCRIEDAEIDHSIIGIRSIIGRNVRLSHTVMMGADFYETSTNGQMVSEAIPIGVGAGSTIERAIIDKNARIGEGVVIRAQEATAHVSGPGYYVRDGIVIVPKNGVIPAGTVI